MMKCNMNSDVIGGLVVILLGLTSSCMTSPVVKTEPTTVSTTTTTFLGNTSWSLNDTTAGNVTCTGSECASSDKFNLAVTLFLRVVLISACVFAFVALVKLSDVLNRRCTCTCKKKRNIYFTKL